MNDLVFMDTETLGLHPYAPIWEFAAIVRHSNTPEMAEASGILSSQLENQFFIQHTPGRWFDELPESFQNDYMDRYDPAVALDERTAAARIASITKGGHVVGAVPSFDTIRLEKLLTRNGYTPGWHYHLIDVENVVAGYLAATTVPMLPPYRSDELSAAVGVDPEQFARHTAMGDVLWVMAQWDAVMGGAR